MGVRIEKREKVKGREDLRVLIVKKSESAKPIVFPATTKENIYIYI